MRLLTNIFYQTLCKVNNYDQQNQVEQDNLMKALMVNSTSGRVINQKMRDEMYMRHLREVEKINNRQAYNVSRAISNYKSINELHHKHKNYAFQWHNKEEKGNIEEKNKRIQQKISQIRSNLQPTTQRKHTNQQSTTSPVRMDTIQVEDNNPEFVDNFKKDEMLPQNNASNMRKSQQKPQNIQKRQHSLHYRYRKKRQEEIDNENSKLVKAILSQRSPYLPNIYRSSHKNGIISKSLQKETQSAVLEPVKI